MESTSILIFDLAAGRHRHAVTRHAGTPMHVIGWAGTGKMERRSVLCIVLDMARGDFAAVPTMIAHAIR